MSIKKGRLAGAQGARLCPGGLARIEKWKVFGRQNLGSALQAGASRH